VEKKLNMFQKGHRRIVLDFSRKLLRNEKMDGTLHKQFPLEQVSGCFADPQVCVSRLYKGCIEAL
jgi:hypothetical protein